MERQTDSITIIVKATENCNSNCVYCSVEGKERAEVRMSPEVLEMLIKRVNEYLKGDSHRRVNIVWHGGEPLLMGTAFFEKIFEAQQRIAGNDAWRIANSLQSNILLYNESFEEIFRKLGINYIGTSYEYVSGLRGLGKNVDSVLYSKKFFEAAKKLRKAGIGYGIIYVVTSKSVKQPIETINYLMNLAMYSRNIHIRLNPVYKEGEARKSSLSYLYVTSEDYGHFLGQAFVHWYNRRHIFTQIQPITPIFDRFFKPNSSAITCDESGICGMSHLGVDASGGIYQCGRAMDAGLLLYGNLKDNDLENVFNNDLKRVLDKRDEALLKNDCALCRFFDYCHGGCPIDGKNYYDDWHHKTYFCETKKIFFEQYFEPTLGIKLQRSQANALSSKA